MGLESWLTSSPEWVLGDNANMSEIDKKIWAPPGVAAHLVTTNEIARSLNIDRTLAARLIKAGAVGRMWTLDETGSKLGGERGALGELAERTMLDPNNPELPPAVVVRIGEAQPEDGTDRLWTGWHADMPEDIAEAATNRWWPLARTHHLGVVGKLLVVSLSTVIVRVRRIVAVKEAAGFARVMFETTSAQGEDAEKYQDKRLQTRQGPVATPINLN